uniref:FCP1 homology domain-containing protein n=4 Tax=Chenopodium quinoa TaxID=63459 RepID=A0A803MV73_CHEQI
MPSLRMKMKSSVCCVKEKNCLRVCHKSNTISKRSHVKTSQMADDADTCCQSCPEVSPSSGSNNQDTGATNSDEWQSCEDIFKQLATSFNDSAVTEGMLLNAQGLLFFCTGVNIDSDPFQFSMAEESDGNSGSSSDYRTCNISDFYISDMILAGSTFDGSFMCDNIAEKLTIPAHEVADSNVFFDGTERHMTLPLLSDSAELSEILHSRPSEEAKMDSDDSSFLLAIHQIRPGEQEADHRSCDDSDEAQYFDPHSFIRNLPDLSEVVPSTRPTILPKESWEKKPVTLVLDLDETLVHSTLDHCEDADFTFTVFFNMKAHTVYVKERPHLRSFLKKVAEMFEIIVFTASQSIYAEQLLDILDPDGKLISGRVYRESCIFSDGSYTKDLTVLGLDLAKVMIVDNSPQVFRLQVNNGIPIKSWFDDPSDNELMTLVPFLETLADVNDVRPLIAKRFGNKE